MRKLLKYQTPPGRLKSFRKCLLNEGKRRRGGCGTDQEHLWLIVAAVLVTCLQISSGMTTTVLSSLSPGFEIPDKSSALENARAEKLTALSNQSNVITSGNEFRSRDSNMKYDNISQQPHNGNSDIQCPSFAENSACPCYKFDDGLFLECPGTTAFSLRTTLQLITSPIQSLSVYDFDQSVTVLSQDLFSGKQRIRHLQFSHSHLQKVSDNGLSTIANTLESLSIVNGKLTQVPHRALVGLQKLAVIDFESNAITDVPDESFDGLHLTKLNLKSNLLQQISTNAFRGVEMTLSEIDLSDNKLKTFPLLALRQLDNLRSLRLALNDMELLQWDGVTKLISLQFLDLSSNSFDELGDSFFRPFQKLKTLSLYSNKISSIHRNAFKLLKDLVSLDISHNYIVELDPGILEANKRLQTIDLSHNHIHFVNGMFSDLPYLREVFLSENNILELTEDVFVNSTRISVVYLEHNAIRRIDSNAFRSLANLQQLYLSVNFINRLPSTVFEATVELTSLSLDGNEIQALDRNLFKTCLNLRELRLHNNKLRAVEREAFHPLPALIELHLQNNQITSIERQSFGTMKSLQHINLQNNKLQQLDINFSPSPLLTIQLEGNRLSHINENAFRNLSQLQILWLNHNQLTSISRDLFKDLSNLERLYLANNSIEKINVGAFREMRSLKVLDLTSNSLTEVKKTHFSPHLSELEELVLKSNRIQSIEAKAFDKSPKLRLLDLSFNYLTTLERDLLQESLQVNTITLQMSGLSKIASDAFRNMNNLYELDLSDNLLKSEDIKKLMIPSLRILKLSNNINLNDTRTTTNQFSASYSISNSVKSVEKLEKMFDNLPSLQILKVDNCSIFELPEMVFSRNTNLVKIDLSYNNLSSVTRNVFNGLNVFKELRLTGNYLNEFPYIALSNISTLETLVLSNNLITSVDFFKLNGLPNLRLLDLKDNLISSISGFNLVNLTQLDFVDFSGNYLLSLPTNFFHNSISLHRVDLSRNRFQHIPNTALGTYSLPRLSWLNFTGNPLSVFYDGHIPGTKDLYTFPFLNELHISNTNLTILTSKDFDSFPALQKLFLVGNRINRISPGAFTGLKKLLTLDVSVNELERLPKERLQGLLLLRHLNLSHNSLKDLDEFSADLLMLRVVDLSFNQLTRINKVTFRGLVNLNELHLRGNRITTVSAEGFRTLQKLSLLDLRNNYFEQLPLRAIEEVEPYLKVLRVEDNPLHCTCETQELWEWLRDHQKLVRSPSDDNKGSEVYSFGKQPQSGSKEQENSRDSNLIHSQKYQQAFLLADGEISGDAGDFANQERKTGTLQLMCDQPSELHGRALIDLQPQSFCNAPLIVKVAIQDIQPYSVVVSWQSREHSGLQGYHIIYHPLDSNAGREVRSKTLNRSASSAKLFKLSSSTRYQICVVGIGSWIQYLPSGELPPVQPPPPSSSSSLFSLTSYYSSVAASVGGSSSSSSNNRLVVEQNSALELLPADLDKLLTNNTMAKCQEVTTLDATLNLIIDENGLAGHSFIHSILTRRLGLTVGCCLGIIVFIVLISVLGWLKLKKQRIIDESKRNIQPMPPEFISYRHFSIPNEEQNRVSMPQDNGMSHNQQQYRYQNHHNQQTNQHPKYISRNELGSTQQNS